MISYSCMSNIATVISSTNKQKIKGAAPQQDKACSCRNKPPCPLNGNCLEKVSSMFHLQYFEAVDAINIVDFHFQFEDLSLPNNAKMVVQISRHKVKIHCSTKMPPTLVCMRARISCVKVAKNVIIWCADRVVSTPNVLRLQVDNFSRWHIPTTHRL